MAVLPTRRTVTLNGPPCPYCKEPMEAEALLFTRTVPRRTFSLPGVGATHRTKTSPVAWRIRHECAEMPAVEGREAILERALAGTREALATESERKRALLDETKKLRAERDELRACLKESQEGVTRLRQERDDLVEELTRERARREEQRGDGEGTLAGMAPRPFLIPAEGVQRVAVALYAGWELAKDSTAPYGPGWALDFARHYRDFCALVFLNPARGVVDWLEREEAEVQKTRPVDPRPRDNGNARPHLGVEPDPFWDAYEDSPEEFGVDLDDPEPGTEQTIDGPVWEWVSDPAELKAGDRIRWVMEGDRGFSEERECMLEDLGESGYEEAVLVDPRRGRPFVVFYGRWSKWVAGGGVYRLTSAD